MYQALKNIRGEGISLKAGDLLSEDKLRDLPALRGALFAKWIVPVADEPHVPDPVEHVEPRTWHEVLLEDDPF